MCNVWVYLRRHTRKENVFADIEVRSTCFPDKNCCLSCPHPTLWQRPGPFTLGTKNACTSSTRDVFTVSCQCHARLSVSNSAVLERKGIRRLRCPKNLLFRDPEFGSRPIGRPVPRFRDVCKRNMLATGLSVKNWELLTEDRSEWKITCSQAL